MRHIWLVVVTLVTVTGCDRGRAELTRALAESRAAEAQKDSLLTEVLETTQFVSDLNSELSRARISSLSSEFGDLGIPGAEQDREERKATLQRIHQLIERLNESEAKLTATENRAKNAKIRNARLLAQISTYKQNIEDLKTAAEQQRIQQEAVIEHQRTQIASLSGQVDNLSGQAASLRDTVHNLTNYKNRVYYAVGTKDELLRSGVVTKEGSKFLIFGGTRLEPARKPNLDAFTVIDKTQTLSISLPRTDKKYKIVSRQSPEYLSGEVNDKGEVSGVVEIASPEEFWAPSKFLILVQK
jgi:multidrug efflux pump subunit AcrA (membrane-fusion protein)